MHIKIASHNNSTTEVNKSESSHKKALLGIGGQ